MKIKSVCELTGLTDRTIRYYIEEKLISPLYTENYLGRKTYNFSEKDINDLNNTDTDAMKAAFEDLYQRMHGMPLQEMDRIVDAVCTLCREHEKAGFVEGMKVGLLLLQGFEEMN